MKERNEKGKSGAERIPPELVAQARAGDQAAFTELYERTSAMVYRTIHSMVRDEDLVWDIQQDSYLRAWRSLDKLEANEAFLPWLRRIAVNTAAKTLAKRVPLTFTDLAGDEEDREPEIPDLNPDVQPELALDRKETARLVREILAELSPEQQAVVGMFYYEDMPVKDIAALLQISPSTVKNQLFRGRKKVEIGVRALEKQGVKLYGLSPLPFLLALFRQLEPAAREQNKVLDAVLAETPAAGAVTVTALTAGQAFLKGLGVKLLAGALAAVVLIGGKLSYDALTKDRELPPIGDEQPTVAETVAPTEPRLETRHTLRRELNDPIPENDPAAPSQPADPSEPTEPEQNHPADPEEPQPDTPEEDASQPPAPEPEEPDILYSGSCGTDVTWALDSNGVMTITGTGKMEELPEDTREDLVTYYGQDHVRSSVKKILISDGVSWIPDGAFANCTELEAVSIPGSVVFIGGYAFLDCCSLTSVTIPDGVTQIAAGTFQGCSALSSVSLPSSITAIGDFAFNACSGLTSVTIPDSVTSIGYDAFSYCSGLTSVTIPDSVTDIGSDAFENCTGLVSVTLPANIDSLSWGLFKGCSSLNSVIIPERVETIYSEVFSGCTGLTSLTIYSFHFDIYAWNTSDGQDFTKLTVCGYPGSSAEAFANYLNCSFIPLEDAVFSGLCGANGDNLTWTYHTGTRTLTIEGSGEMVNNWSAPWYEFTSGICAVSLPNGLSSIGNNAFRDCHKLSSIVIPEGVTCIGNSAFESCTGLTSVTIPESVTSIGDYVFYECEALTSVTIPKGVTSIGKSAFEYCTSLTSVVIPEGVIALGNCAFYRCFGLTSVTIPESVTSIGGGAFYNCLSLTSVTISEGVTSIGGGAFNDCTSLTCVRIPSSVTRIEQRAFGWYLGDEGEWWLLDGFTISGSTGSEAERYANENGIPFEALP